VKDAGDDAVAHSTLLPADSLPPNLAHRAAQESAASRDARRAAAAAGIAVVLAALALQLPPPAAALALGLYGLAAALALRGFAAAGRPHGRFGLANRLTLLRAGGAAIIAGLATTPGLVSGPTAWAIAGAAALLLALDGIDGWIARRQGLASPYGARLDMETDALTILTLAALALALGKAGPWVLALGLMRYVFVTAGWALPWLAAPLPPSSRRKAVCALQIAILAALLAPPLAPPVSSGLAALALAALVASFAVDIAWLARARR